MILNSVNVKLEASKVHFPHRIYYLTLLIQNLSRTTISKNHLNLYKLMKTILNVEWLIGMMERKK